MMVLGRTWLVVFICLLLSGCNYPDIWKMRITLINVIKDTKDRESAVQAKYGLLLLDIYQRNNFDNGVAGYLVYSYVSGDIEIKEAISENKIKFSPEDLRNQFACFLTEGRLERTEKFHNRLKGITEKYRPMVEVADRASQTYVPTEKARSASGDAMLAIMKVRDDAVSKAFGQNAFRDLKRDAENTLKEIGLHVCFGELYMRYKKDYVVLLSKHIKLPVY